MKLRAADWPPALRMPPHAERGEAGPLLGERSFVSPPTEYEFGAWAPFNKAVKSEVVFVEARWTQEVQILEQHLKSLFGHTEKLQYLCDKVEELGATLRTILKRVEGLGVGRPVIWVPIASLAPEPYELVRPFTAVVAPSDEGFEASFFDANIHASGDTEEEAIANLKGSLLDAYDRLAQLGERQLGPGPMRQKQVLDLHIRRKQV